MSPLLRKAPERLDGAVQDRGQRLIEQKHILPVPRGAPGLLQLCAMIQSEPRLKGAQHRSTRVVIRAPDHQRRCAS